MDPHAGSSARTVARGNNCAGAVGDLRLGPWSRFPRNRFFRPLGYLCGSVAVDRLINARAVSRFTHETKLDRNFAAVCPGRTWLCAGPDSDPRIVVRLPN